MVVSQTGRTHDCTDKPSVTKFDLAMQEPSTHAVGEPPRILHPRSRLLPFAARAKAQVGLSVGLRTEAAVRTVYVNVRSALIGHSYPPLIPAS